MLPPQRMRYVHILIEYVLYILEKPKKKKERYYIIFFETYRTDVDCTKQPLPWYLSSASKKIIYLIRIPL